MKKDELSESQEVIEEQNNNSDKKTSSNGLFIGIKSFFELIVTGAKEQFNKQKNKKHQTEQEQRFDIGIDDVQGAYAKVPKKIGLITVAISFIVIIMMTLMTVSEQVSEVDKSRAKVKKELLKEGEVEIDVDEQGWKHYQSKRIDKVVENSTKALKEIRKEMGDNAKELQMIVREDLNSTLTSVKTYIDKLDNKLVNVEKSITAKLNQQNIDIDNKLVQNSKDITKKLIHKNADGTNSIILTDDMKFLPPPLKGLNAKSQITKVKIVEKEDVVEETVLLYPDSDEYDYSDVDIDDITVATTNIRTIAYDDSNNTEETKVLKLHIMKGLVNATLLAGVNVATFGSGGSRNPAPVLLSIDGDTFIANEEVQNIGDCLVSGVATGNVNTSRADILLTDVSCSGYNIDGEQIKIEQELKGWVIGEDGSFGLQGRLIDSSGKVITKMIAVEMIQSMANAMVVASQQTGTATGVSGIGGASSVPSVQDSAQTSLGEGVNKGLDSVFEHYDEILSGMYPTISIRAGKKVSILFKGGEDITPSVYDNIDIREEYEVER